MAEHRSPKPGVQGSSPCGPVSLVKPKQVREQAFFPSLPARASTARIRWNPLKRGTTGARLARAAPATALLEHTRAEPPANPGFPTVHRLKNGVEAHRLTDADRRKAAAVTNEKRRAKRELIEQLELNRRIEEMLGSEQAAPAEAARALPAREAERGVGSSARCGARRARRVRLAFDPTPGARRRRLTG